MESLQVKLERIEQKLDELLSKETETGQIPDFSPLLNKLEGFSEFPLMVEKINFISSQYTPTLPEPTAQERAQAALEALKKMQIELAHQASNIPAPEAPWIDEENPVRIFISNTGIKNLLLSNKALIDFAFENDFTKQDVGVGAFVYMLYLSDEDRLTLSNVGVQIQERV